MKKIIFLTAIALSLCSCAKTELTGIEAGEMLIGASVEAYSSGTKAALADNDGSFTWQAGDAIGVATSHGHANFNLKSGAGNASATFSAIYSGTLGNYAVYPADIFVSDSKIKVPASRVWSEGNTNCSMFGSLTNGNVDFKHLGGVVKVTLNGVPAEAKKFVFSTPGKKITGEFDIQTETGENGNKYIATSEDSGNANSSYTLSFTLNEAQNMAFYIPVPCGTYPKFAFKVLGAEDVVLNEFEGSSQQIVNRKDILIMPTLTIGTITGDGDDAEKGAISKTVPAGTKGNYRLPAAEKVILNFEGVDEPGYDVINLVYDGTSQLPSQLWLRVASGKKVNVSGELPYSTVEFDEGVICTANFKTAQNTFKIVAPARIEEKLTVKGGNVEISGPIEGANNVKAIEVEVDATADGTSAPVQITLENQATVGAPGQSGESGITTSANVVIVNNTDADVNVAVPDEVKETVQVASAGTGTGEVKKDGEKVTTKPAAAIGTQNFFTLSDAIKAVKNNEQIDIIAEEISATAIPIGSKKFTIDLGNKEVTVVGPAVGSSQTMNQAFQINSGNTITIKNGTIKCDNTNNIFRFVIQNYADLTLEDVTVDGTNLKKNDRTDAYTVSSNFGTITFAGNTTVKASTVSGVDAYAIDLYDYTNHGYTATAAGVWDSDGSIIGAITLGGGSLTVSKELKLTKPMKAYKGDNGIVNLTVNANIIPGDNFDGDALVIVNRGGDLTISGSGKVSNNNNAGIYCAVKMTEAADVVSDSETNRAKLTVDGSVTLEGYQAGISGNGNDGRGHTDVTINGSVLVKGCATDIDECCGIYQPQNGTLTINGGTIEGLVGVYVKSGSVTTAVSGGTIKGTGAKGTYSPTGNGFINTGDAIVFDNCDYPGGAPNAEILGGTFTSANGDAVASYAKSGNDPITGFIKGGTFSSKPAENLLASGYAATENGGVWTVAKIVAAKIGETTYSTLKAALDAAVSNDVIVLCMDIIREKVSDNSDRETYDVSGKTITLDLNGHTIKHRYGLNKKGVFEVKNATLTIDDSSIEKNGKIADTYAQAVLSAENSVVNLKNGILAAEYSSTSSTNYRVVKLKNTTFTMDGGSVLAATTGSYNRAFEFVHSTGTNSKVIVNNGIIKTFTSYAVVFYGDSDGYQGENNTVEINGGEISTQGNYGWLGDDMFGEITMNGGSFTSNWHQVVDTNTTFTHNGGTVNIKSN